MDREISKEVRQKEQRKQFIKLGAGIGIAVVLIGGVIGFMQTSLQRKDLVFSTVDKGVIEVSVSASGKVVPAFEEIINSPINSRIVEIYKKGGDSVDVGTPILKLGHQLFGKLHRIELPAADAQRNHDIVLAHLLQNRFALFFADLRFDSGRTVRRFGQIRQLDFLEFSETRKPLLVFVRRVAPVFLFQPPHADQRHVHGFVTPDTITAAITASTAAAIFAISFLLSAPPHSTGARFARAR